DVGKCPAACELHADMPVPTEVAGAREDEIAESAQACQRLTFATDRTCEACDLGETARNQRRERVVPEAETLDDAGGDGDDVLHRAADLDARHVGAAVQPEMRTAELGLDEARGPFIRRCSKNGRGQLTRNFDRKARTRQDDDRTPRSQLLCDHL